MKVVLVVLNVLLVALYSEIYGQSQKRVHHVLSVLWAIVTVINAMSLGAAVMAR
jgi:hypothetical protein